MYNTGMAIGLFGGSFDPVHSQHLRYAQAAIEHLGLKKLFVLPSFVAPHKLSGAHASATDRLQMCKIAFQAIPEVEVSDYEIAAEGTSYSYLTCRHFSNLYPDEEIYFLVGADMLDDFFTWKNPDELLSYATLAACGRGTEGVEAQRERFYSRFQKQFLHIPFTGEEVSSTKIRTDIAFEKPVDLPCGVAEYIKERKLYSHDCIPRALALEKPSRREHSYRVALMATSRARGLKILEQKALLAAALHDCAKYLPSDSPLLSGFCMEGEVPPPVLHQFTGAYVAQTQFNVEDGEVLNAIRYHTSGRENMTPLDKLIFLSDMLESERDFPHVEALRALFYEDIDECLYQSLRHQVEYLKQTGKPIYPLTERAYAYCKREKEKV